MKFSLVRRHCSLLVAAGLLAGPTGLVPAAGAKTVPKLLVLGDSLSAEYGLQRGEGWVALLQLRLQQQHLPAVVVNASISGDTTSGGRSRLPALLAQHQPTLVIIELGANDALRGLALAQSQDNLQAMAQAARAAGAKVLLVGMQVPPNYGQSYGAEFASMYRTVAKATGAELVPFMLKGVADGADATGMFQPDRLHPLAKAHPIILNTLWPAIRKLL
ncbi:MAG: arylesterase [Rhodoferax sp.]|nr:arylesterase [Rhodoferax sp.]